ncbi:MAG: hypothetical protein QFX34_03065 [Candidatus Verstraetearchaeota archaeon]|nr:hypothetical protein [Candidatus Verstraetearchaeota archaeon]
MAIILWYKSLDLLIAAPSLSAYFLGFLIGVVYVQRSPSSLSRLAGIFLSSHVITTIALAGFGYGYLTIFITGLVGITSGGLLSLPLSKLLSTSRALLLSAFPLIGAFLLVNLGADSPLVASALISFIGAVLVFASLKIMVPKPVLLAKASLRLPKEFGALALVTSIGCSLGTLLTPIVALVEYSIDPLWIGALITASLLLTNLLGRALASQKSLQRSMVATIGFSLLLVFIVLGISPSRYFFMVLWLVALIDVSAYNTFVVAAVNTIKKCEAQSFNLFSSAVTPLGSLLGMLIWAVGSYQSMFFLAALFILISVLILRLLLKGEQTNAGP